MESTTTSNCSTEKEYQFPTVSLLNPKNQTGPQRDEFRKLVESSAFSEKRIPIIIGTDEEGNAVIDDLVEVKHLLSIDGPFISIFYSGAILGIFFKNRPEDVQLILVDAWTSVLRAYEDTPHLLSPIICDPYTALGMLDWVTVEIIRRRQVFIEENVSDLEDYNGLEAPHCPKMPHIVILLNGLKSIYKVSKAKTDPLIDLLIRDGAEVGIHLILGSHHPLSDELYFNLAHKSIPARLVTKTKSEERKRAALGVNSAEKFPGGFKALYRSPGFPEPVLVHFPDYRDGQSARNDIERVVSYLKSNNSCDMTDKLMLEFKSRGQVIKAELDNEHMETVCKQLNEAAEFFQNVLTNSFHNGQFIDREIFSWFCGYVKLMYLAFYEETAKEVLIGAMPAFRTLAQLSEADNRYCNFECEIIRRFSSMTLCAIEEIGGDFTREDHIFTLVYPTLKYNFDEDTPEAVYNCIKSALIEEQESGKCQYYYKDDINGSAKNEFM